MERKRIVLILLVAIVAVGGIIGLALWQFHPATQAARTPANQSVSPLASTSTNPTTANPTDPATTPSANPIDPVDPNVVPPAINNNVNVVSYISGGAQNNDTSTRTIRVGPDGVVQNTGLTAKPESTNETKPEAIDPKDPKAVASITNSVQSTTVIQNTNTDSSVSKPLNNSAKTPSSNVSAKTPSATSSKPLVRGKEYWIQVISSPNRDRVEQVKLEMTSKGFNGRISVKEIAKKDYYRLRYGPFGDNAEAKRFLSYIQIVPGLEGAYIVEEYPVK